MRVRMSDGFRKGATTSSPAMLLSLGGAATSSSVSWTEGATMRLRDSGDGDGD